MSAGNGKKKMGQLKGYKCFTRTNKSGIPYTTCKDDEEQLRIGSAKKKKELYKKPTKPTTVPAKQPKKKKASPKPKKPRGRPKAPPKVKKAPAKRGRPSTGKMDERKAEADKKRKARLAKKNKVMTPTAPKKKQEEDTDDEDNEMLVFELDLSKNRDDVNWKGKQLYINDKTGVIYDPESREIVGKRVVVVKGGNRETMYKITDKDFALKQQRGGTADLRFFGRLS
jgi:outer membrane biosynthesis protein TonB